MVKHPTKKHRREKRKKHAKRVQHRFGGCCAGSRQIIRCSICLGKRRVGKTRKAQIKDTLSKKKGKSLSCKILFKL